MESFDFLLFLAIILVSTKILGIFSRKVHMPQVVGALLAGIILGPSVLDLVQMESDGNFLSYTAEIGVILLMFSAGLETDLTELKKNGISSFVVALCGVLVPLLGGFVTYALYFHVDVTDFKECMKAVFIGVVLTATSVSITVETLRELGHLKGKVGVTILGAAIIDDILGIIVLTVVTSLEDASVNPISILVKILLYFVVVGIIWFVLSRLKPVLESWDRLRRTSIMSLAFCFLMAYISEEFFEIADITGAYFAGLMLCSMKIEDYVNRRVSIAAYLIFSPVFFASIGMKTNLDGLTGSVIIFSFILLVVAILTKVIGCGLGAKLCKYKNKESLQIGVGMISRGEVALIVAQKGYQAGMLNDSLFAPIVLVVIVTTLITPILLGMVFKGEKKPEELETTQA